MQYILLLGNHVERYKKIRHPDGRFSFDDQSVMTQYLRFNQDQGNLIKPARKDGHPEELVPHFIDLENVQQHQL